MHKKKTWENTFGKLLLIKAIPKEKSI
ncbi:hypothetical protein F383_34616 [Gossypium arboreum]|uniref:Uncharacterized protein n=1 Tax=Gossypium arboreum TaxID=29729 RepID=A0A0B0N2H4_GOSAR|nr:hypothetical protein F383_34616 [Gossypium arboreum]